MELLEVAEMVRSEYLTNEKSKLYIFKAYGEFEYDVFQEGDYSLMEYIKDLDHKAILIDSCLLMGDNVTSIGENIAYYYTKENDKYSLARFLKNTIAPNIHIDNHSNIHKDDNNIKSVGDNIQNILNPTDNNIKYSKRGTSKAQQRATAKYCKIHYDEIKLRVPKGDREILKQKAEALGMSLNAYIISCIF